MEDMGSVLDFFRMWIQFRSGVERLMHIQVTFLNQKFGNKKPQNFQDLEICVVGPFIVCSTLTSALTLPH